MIGEQMTRETTSGHAREKTPAPQEAFSPTPQDLKRAEWEGMQDQWNEDQNKDREVIAFINDYMTKRPELDVKTKKVLVDMKEKLTKHLSGIRIKKTRDLGEITD